MLSRVGERMYWLGRQIERAENTARLVRVSTSLLLDLPPEARLGWDVLLNITGAEDDFARSGEEPSEQAVVSYLIADDSNPSSIRATVSLARENARTAREILPTEAWEQLNDLHLFVSASLPRALEGHRRHPFLTSVVERTQLVQGILEGTMSRDAAHDFIYAGRNLERADMTTRIVDVGSATLRRDAEGPETTFDEIVWMAVLRSLGGYQMYRRHVRHRVAPHTVVAFLLRDPFFPRSVRRATDELTLMLERLPRNEAPLAAVARFREVVVQTPLENLSGPTLHELLDEYQMELGRTHEAIAATWFTLPRAA